MADSKDSKVEVKVEEDLSRMEGAYGKELIGKLKKMEVLIVGLRGLGIEVAKNLILAGPKAVTVVDNGRVQIADLGANFYLLPEDLAVPDQKDEKGKVVKKGRPARTRAEASFRELSTLNPNVSINVHAGAVTNELISKYHVVAFCDFVPLKDLIAYDTFCRAHNIKFIYAHIAGLATTTFVDFGPAHRSFDVDGVLELNIIIDNITNAKKGVVTIDGERHLLDNGDVIRISGVKGMELTDKSIPVKVDREGQGQVFYTVNEPVAEINSCIQVEIDQKKPNIFYIGDTTKLTPYEHGGTGTQVKIHKIFSHRSLAENILAPTFNNHFNDFLYPNGDVQAQLHLANLAVWQFEAVKGHLPRLHNRDDAEAVLGFAEALNKTNETPAFFFSPSRIVKVPQVDANLVRKVALFFATEFTGLAALLGGVVAQEIVKQTGKYTPVTQWFNLSALEMSRDDEKGQPLIPADAKAIGSRHDHQICLFGKSVQDKIQKQKVFLVGCGALGCEYLKAIAMTGLGCDAKEGEVHITDMDRIELSNLSRQFLFRRVHVGQPKSKSGGDAVKKMNPELENTLRVHEVRVGPDTEHIFNDQFWQKIDLVLNALDNIQARLYTDQKCVLHEKPLFESGTLGTRANTVIVIPGKTPSYGEGATAGEGQGIAKCTLQNFPALPLHCIEWAREMFDENFVDGAQKANDFLENPAKWLAKNAQDENEQLDGLRTVRHWLNLMKNASLASCVELAFNDFNKRYRNAINDLTHAFPRDARNIDAKTKADLGPFWHGHKRFPQAAAFDAKNEAHLDYIYHATAIYCSIFKIPEQKNKAVIFDIVSKLKAAPWAPSGKKIQLEEDKKEEKSEVIMSDSDYKEIETITKELESFPVKQYAGLVPVDFEKDYDPNHHIDWITSATNMRAWNYYIEPSTKATCRLTAGRIIPAIATTTATITGFVQLEVFKHALGLDHATHRGVTLDLAVNNFTLEALPDLSVKKDFIEKVEVPNPENEFKKIIKNVQWRVLPAEGVSVWSKFVVNKGDLTFAGLIKEIETKFPGLKVEALFKKGVTDKEVKEGKGSNLWTATNPFAGQLTQMKNFFAQTKNPALGKQVEALQASFDAHAKKVDSNVIQTYLNIYGPLITPERNYVQLDGNYINAAGERTIIPSILYIFKSGSLQVGPQVK